MALKTVFWQHEVRKALPLVSFSWFWHESNPARWQKSTLAQEVNRQAVFYANPSGRDGYKIEEIV